MLSERMQEQVDGLLGQAGNAVAAMDWLRVLEADRAVLLVDPVNADAQAFVVMAEGSLDEGARPSRQRHLRTPSNLAALSASPDDPTSFASGRPSKRRDDLRHTGAIIMGALGVDMRVIQEVLGHNDYSFTATGSGDR